MHVFAAVVIAALIGQTAPAKAVDLRTPSEKAADDAVAQVKAIRYELNTSTSLTVGAKKKMKKRLAYATNVARDAIQTVQNEKIQKEEQAYIDKMMPIWREQQRQNTQFSIEAAKAQALQQMAITQEKQRQQDLWLQWQRNQIMASEAQSLQQMAR